MHKYYKAYCRWVLVLSLLFNSITVIAADQLQYLSPGSPFQGKGRGKGGAATESEQVVFSAGGLQIHLPYRIWREFNARLIAELNEAGTAENAEADVQAGILLGRREMEVLAEVFNKEEGRSGDLVLAADDIEDYVRYYEDICRIMNENCLQEIQNVYKFLTGVLGKEIGELERTLEYYRAIAQGQCAESASRELVISKVSAGKMKLAGVRTQFENNYGRVPGSDFEFFKLMMATWVANSDVLGTTVELMPNRKKREELVPLEDLWPEEIIYVLQRQRIDINMWQFARIQTRLAGEMEQLIERRLYRRALHGLVAVLDRYEEGLFLSPEQRVRLRIARYRDDMLEDKQNDRMAEIAEQLDIFAGHVRKGDVKLSEVRLDNWMVIFSDFIEMLMHRGMYEEAERFLNLCEEIFSSREKDLEMPHEYYLIKWLFKSAWVLDTQGLDACPEDFERARADLERWQEYCAGHDDLTDERSSVLKVPFLIGWSYFLEGNYREALGYFGDGEELGFPFCRTLSRLFTAVADDDWETVDECLAIYFNERAGEGDGRFDQNTLFAKGVSRIAELEKRWELMCRCRERYGKTEKQAAEIVLLYSLLLCHLGVADVVALLPGAALPEPERGKGELEFVDEELVNPTLAPRSDEEKGRGEGTIFVTTSFVLRPCPPEAKVEYARSRIAGMPEAVVLKLWRTGVKWQTKQIREMWGDRLAEVRRVFQSRIRKRYCRLLDDDLNVIWVAYQKGEITEKRIDEIMKAVPRVVARLRREYTDLCPVELPEEELARLPGRVLRLHESIEGKENIEAVCEREFGVCVYTELNAILKRYDYEWAEGLSWRENLTNGLAAISGLYEQTMATVNQELVDYPARIGQVDGDDVDWVRGLIDGLAEMAFVLRKNPEEVTEIRERYRKFKRFADFVIGILRPELYKISVEEDPMGRMDRCVQLGQKIEDSGYKDSLGEQYAREVADSRLDAEERLAAFRERLQADTAAEIAGLELAEGEYSRDKVMEYVNAGDCDAMRTYLFCEATRKTEIAEQGLTDDDYDAQVVQGYVDRLDVDGLEAYLKLAADKKRWMDGLGLQGADVNGDDLAEAMGQLNRAGVGQCLITAGEARIGRQLRGMQNALQQGDYDSEAQIVTDLDAEIESYDDLCAQLGLPAADEELTLREQFMRIGEIDRNLGILRTRFPEVTNARMLYDVVADCMERREGIDVMTRKVITQPGVGKIGTGGKLFYTKGVVVVPDAGAFNHPNNMAHDTALYRDGAKSIVIFGVEPNRRDLLLGYLVFRHLTRPGWQEVEISINEERFASWDLVRQYSYQQQAIPPQDEKKLLTVLLERRIGGMWEGRVKSTLTSSALCKVSGDSIEVWLVEGDHFLHIVVETGAGRYRVISQKKIAVTNFSKSVLPQLQQKEDIGADEIAGSL